MFYIGIYAAVSRTIVEMGSTLTSPALDQIPGYAHKIILQGFVTLIELYRFINASFPILYVLYVKQRQRIHFTLIFSSTSLRFYPGI
jgi:hypothetical protein